MKTSEELSQPGLLVLNCHKLCCHQKGNVTPGVALGQRKLASFSQFHERRPGEGSEVMQRQERDESWQLGAGGHPWASAACRLTRLWGGSFLLRFASPPSATSAGMEPLTLKTLPAPTVMPWITFNPRVSFPPPMKPRETFKFMKWRTSVIAQVVGIEG